MKLTIEDLAEKVNNIISENFKNNYIKDGRQSFVLSPRRIRDYITKGLIDKPVGDGREKWFDESHVNALVSLRLLQHNGLSEQYIISSTKTRNVHDDLLSDIQDNTSSLISNSVVKKTEEDMKNNALDFLRSLKDSPRGVQRDNVTSQNIHNSLEQKLQNNSLVGNANQSYYATAKDEDLTLIRALNQSKYKQFNEYCLDDKLGVFLKVDSKTNMDLQKKLCEKIKQEIINYTKGE
jgi:DNA-binding transcriptional MerR regulator